MCLGGMLIGGMTQAESPEWMPASSMCSITAGTKASSPSARQSASTSMAFSRKRSMRIGRSGETSTAAATYSPQHLLVVDDLHRPAAQHERRPHHQRVADLRATARASSRLLAMPDSGCGMPSRRMAWRKRSRSSARSIMSGEVPRIFTPGRGQLGRQVQRRLAAELHDHPQRLLLLVDAQHVLDRQRLEVELVRGVVVGRDGLRVAVDHDRLVALVAQGEGGVDAAVVELDPLADAVRPAAEHHHLLARRNAWSRRGRCSWSSSRPRSRRR